MVFNKVFENGLQSFFGLERVKLNFIIFIIFIN